MTAKKQALAVGISLTLLAHFLWSVMDGTTKWLTGHGYPVLEITFFNGLVTTVCLATWISIKGDWAYVLKLREPLLLVYTVLAVSAGFTLFRAFGYGNLVEITMVFSSGPFMIALLSSIFLKEHLNGIQLACIIAGFGGVLLILKPSGSIVNAPVYIALLGTFFFSASQIVVRKLRDSVRPRVFVLCFATCFFLISGSLMHYVPVKMAEAPVFLLSGLCDVIALNLLFTAFRFIPAVFAAPFQYTQLIWCGIIGYMFWHQLPDEASLAGAALIVISGVIFLKRSSDVATA